jgi:hypothetical protein
MKKIVLSLLIITTNLIFCQDIKTIKKGDFPEGLYMTLEDVLNKTPSSTEELFFKPAIARDTLKFPEKVFFYFKEENSKVKYPLGVSYKGEIYFQTYRKYTNKKDKGYDPDAYSRFCKATSYGRFVYFEEDIMGIWSKGWKYNLGLIGATTINSKTRGMVIDFEKKEINIFRDCPDMLEFLSVHNLKLINCDKNYLSIEETRKIIAEINK